MVRGWWARAAECRWQRGAGGRGLLRRVCVSVITADGFEGPAATGCWGARYPANTGLQAGAWVACTAHSCCPALEVGS